MKKNHRVKLADESSTYSGDKCDVTFYRWQTLEKRIPKLRIDVLSNNLIRFIKEILKTLKEHIYIKRKT